jgi:hypothetical protein
MRTGDTTSIWPGLYSYYAYEYANLLALPLGDQTQVSQRVFFLDMTSRLPLQFGIDCPGPSISLELYASQYPTATVILVLNPPCPPLHTDSTPLGPSDAPWISPGR